MLENILQQFTEIHHAVFFIGGVIVAGVVSGLCAFYKARSDLKNTIVKLQG